MRQSTLLSWHAFQNQCIQTFPITRSFGLQLTNTKQHLSLLLWRRREGEKEISVPAIPFLFLLFLKVLLVLFNF